jgi:hypothetical protein
MVAGHAVEQGLAAVEGRLVLGHTLLSARRLQGAREGRALAADMERPMSSPTRLPLPFVSLSSWRR